MNRPSLHDYQWLGNGCHPREGIKKRKTSDAKLKKLDILERKAILEAIEETFSKDP